MVLDLKRIFLVENTAMQLSTEVDLSGVGADVAPEEQTVMAAALTVTAVRHTSAEIFIFNSVIFSCCSFRKKAATIISKHRITSWIQTLCSETIFCWRFRQSTCVKNPVRACVPSAARTGTRVRAAVYSRSRIPGWQPSESCCRINKLST